MERIHLVGIGGTGLSAIARVLLERGCVVSGSDREASSYTRDLTDAGARVAIGHAAELVHGADLVLASSAIPADNPELLEARRLGIPVQKRSQFLPTLIGEARTLAVAGTHGKTTTTAMLALILRMGGLEPSFVVGSYIPSLGSNGGAGLGEYFVIEADEYDGMFLGLRPWAAVITGLELDHVDCYPSLEAAVKAYEGFAGNLRPDGMLLVRAGDENAGQAARAGLRRGVGERATLWTYGLEAEADWSATDISPQAEGGSRFVARGPADRGGEYVIRLPGRHNVTNALAALALSDWIGLDQKVVAGALAAYSGAARRFEIVGQAGGVLVVDDYAHHPTAVRATLAAARENYPGRRLWAVFQPHTYSRTLALLEDFAGCFRDADEVIVTDIYGSRERDAGLISSRDLVERIKDAPAHYLGPLDEATAFLWAHVRAGDVVITMGAGDGNLVGHLLLTKLKEEEGANGRGKPGGRAA